MALGVLGIIFGVLIITAIVFQILLYITKDNSKYINFIFLINIVFTLILVFLVFTSLPDNYTGQKILSIIWGIIAGLSILVKSYSGSSMISKVMITIAIIGSFVQLFS